MISAKQYHEAVTRSVEMLQSAGIAITPEEQARFPLVSSFVA